jgi:hypothetical protein
MRKPLRQAASLATLLAFGTLAPRLGWAQPDEPRATPQAQPQQPTTVQPPPTYYPPPGYQQPPPGGYYQQPPPGGYYQQPGWTPPPPVQYRTRYEEKRQMGLFVAGAAIFGAMWLMSGFVGYQGNGTAFGFIPVVGPLFYVKSENPNYYSNSDIRADNALAVFSVIVQAVGVGMGVLGLVLTKKVAVREPIVFGPTLLPNGGGGLAAMGHF